MGDTVVVGSCNGFIHGIDRATGKARWTHEARLDGGRPEFHGLLLEAGDLAILASDDRRPEGVGFVYAIEVSSGRVRWKARIGRGSMTDVVRLGPLVYTVTLENELVALDLERGTTAWSFAGGPPLDKSFLNVFATPAIAGDRVYFGGADGVLYAVGAGSGDLRWRREIGSRIVTPTVLTAGALYVGTQDGRLLRMDPQSGRPRGEIKLESMPSGPPTLMGTSLLVYSAEGDTFVLNALDPGLGASRWKSKGPQGWSSSRPYLWRGSVLAGTKAGELALVSLEDGSPVWKARVDGVVRGVGVRDDDDLLFVGTQGGVVFAVRLPQREP